MIERHVPDVIAGSEIRVPLVAHVVGLGQSNEMGGQSTPVVSGTDAGFGAFKFVRGVQTRLVHDSPADPETRAAADFTFTPLTAAVQEIWMGETPAVGLTSHLAVALRAQCAETNAEPATHFLFTYPHSGGKHLAELDWRDGETNPANPCPGPGGYHATFVDDIRRARRTATSAGMSYEVFAFHLTQGENEGAGYLLPGRPVLTHEAFVPAYKADLALAYERWDADARAQSGQTQPIPLFISQINNYWAGQSQAALADENADVFVVGPIYYVPSALNSLWNGSMRGAYIHLSADGQRWRGEQIGKVMSRVLFEKEDWKPVKPRTIKRLSDTVLHVAFHVPRPPLAFETDWLPTALNYGFEVTLGTEDEPGPDRTIACVTITGSDEVTITLDPATPIAEGMVATLTYGRSATVGTTPGLVAVRAGSPFPHDAEAIDIVFHGDLTAQFAPLLVEGCFVLRQMSAPMSRHTANADVQGGSVVIRDVRREGEFTIGRAEAQSLIGTLVVGAPCLIERDQPFGNLRDSDSAVSVFTFADPSYGTRHGQAYPLQNFCLFFSAIVER